jgi:hypothetical protein
VKHTAHACFYIDTANMVIHGWAVFSSGPGNLTTIGKKMYAEILQVEDESFHKAAMKAEELVKRIYPELGEPYR